MRNKAAGPGVTVTPSAMSNGTTFDESIALIMRLRREYDARPEVTQKRAEDAAADERMRLAKLAAKGKDSGLIGPPDPRKGRLPMTR